VSPILLLLLAAPAKGRVAEDPPPPPPTPTPTTLSHLPLTPPVYPPKSSSHAVHPATAPLGPGARDASVKEVCWKAPSPPLLLLPLLEEEEEEEEEGSTPPASPPLEATPSTLPTASRTHSPYNKLASTAPGVDAMLILLASMHPEG